jgi:heat shock protein HslJ
MKSKTILLVGILLSLLAACAGNIDPVEPGNNPEGKTTGIETNDVVAEEAPTGLPEPASEMVTIIVDDELVDCEGGAGPQKCMRVKFEDSEDWQFFYSQIEGFEFRPGLRYTLLVEKIDVENPPADGSSLRYVLVELIKQERAKMDEPGELSGKMWKLLRIGSEANQRNIVTGSEVTFEFDPESGQIGGTTGCNRYFGSVELDIAEKSLSIEIMGMTRMACREELVQQEFEFVNLLEKVTHYEMEEGQLMLFTDGEDVLVFEVAE